jgi:hypothetical protein
MIEAKIGYYEYRESGGTHIDLNLRFETSKKLMQFLEELRGPVIVPPEVGEDGMLKEKEEIS